MDVGVFHGHEQRGQSFISANIGETKGRCGTHSGRFVVTQGAFERAYDFVPSIVGVFDQVANGAFSNGGFGGTYISKRCGQGSRKLGSLEHGPRLARMTGNDLHRQLPVFVADDDRPDGPFTDRRPFHPFHRFHPCRRHHSFRQLPLFHQHHRDALPRGADVISLVRVAYDHPDERALTILRAVFAALPPGGTLLVAEPMADATGARRMGDAYFGFYLLAMHGGRSRSAARLTELMTQAGFTRIREHATPIPLQVSVLVARKPPT